MDPLIEGKDYTISDLGVLEIFEGVKYIPPKSFECNAKIKSIKFPSTLISIGEEAFTNCSYLSGTLSIPDSVESIMDRAFYYCGFSVVYLGKNVSYIGTQAFHYNSITKLYNNSEKLKVMDKRAFSYNFWISPINFNKNFYHVRDEISDKDNAYYFTNATIIDMYGDIIDENNSSKAPYVCNYKTTDKYSYNDGTLVINDGVEVIGDFSKFDDCTNVIMPNSVVIILPGAFCNLEKLKHVKFSNNLIAIMDDAFYGCSLTKDIVKLPKSLCVLSVESFKRNNGNNKVVVPITTHIFGQIDPLEFPYTIHDYSNDTYIVNNFTLNINELIDEEKKELESLGLLPETINNNKKISHSVTRFQSNTMKKSLIDILMGNDFNEDNNLEFINKILETKSFNLNDFDYIIDHLFVKKQIKTIYLLISYGYNYYDNCMISKAIINDMYEMVDILLILGTNINEVGCVEMTPLSIACKKNDYVLAVHLIEKGAAINMVDMNNKTAIDYAKESNSSKIVELLESYNKQEESNTEKDIITLKKLLDV